jgi:hypothetical protein
VIIDDPTRSLAIELVAQSIATDDLAALAEEWEGSDQKPLMKPTVIQERGQKTRVASKSQAALVVMTQRVNDGMINLLKHDNSANYSFGDNQRNVPHAFKRAATKSISAKLGMEGLSADLSKASDYIQFSVALAVMEGFRDAMGDAYMSSDMFEHELHAIGPMQLDNPTAGREEMLWSEAGLLERVGHQTKRGILMGLSLTWPILTVLNVYCASYTTTDDLTIPPEVRRRPHFTVCGDDLGAIWEKQRTEIYFSKLRAVGLVVNESKSYRSDSLRVLFVERLFLTGKIVKLKQAKTSEEIAKSPRLGGTMAAFMALALAKASGQRSKTFDLEYTQYRTVELVPRVKMSALALSKRSGSSAQPENAPDWVVIPDVYANNTRMQLRVGERHECSNSFPYCTQSHIGCINNPVYRWRGRENWGGGGFQEARKLNHYGGKPQRQF